MKKVVILSVLFMLLINILPGCARMTGRTAGQTIDDGAIATEIRARVVEDPELKLLAINVRSFQGNVTLSGAVPNREAEQRLVNIAKSIKGVQSVTTNLQVARG